MASCALHNAFLFTSIHVFIGAPETPSSIFSAGAKHPYPVLKWKVHLRLRNRRARDCWLNPNWRARWSMCMAPSFCLTQACWEGGGVQQHARHVMAVLDIKGYASLFIKEENVLFQRLFVFYYWYVSELLVVAFELPLVHMLRCPCFQVWHVGKYGIICPTIMLGRLKKVKQLFEGNDSLFPVFLVYDIGEPTDRLIVDWT